MTESLAACFDDTDKNVLQFHEWLTEAVCSESLNKYPILHKYSERYSNAIGMDWPCVPRIRPSAFADSTHDLPGFNRFSRKLILSKLKHNIQSSILRTDLNIIAWSKLGKIAASFGVDLVLWIPHSESTVVYRLEGINALSFSNTGKLLAVSIKKGLLCGEWWKCSSLL